MISMTFKGECPYCRTEYRSTIVTEADIEGDLVEVCRDCKKRFIVHWFVIVDATTMTISETTSPVRCAVDLESWFDEEEEEGEIEA